MTQVRTIVDSLTTLTDTFLGVDYTELKYKHIIEDNSELGASKKFGVIAQDVNEVSGALGFVTVNQNYEITLTDKYKTLKGGDESKDNARIRLQDLSLNLYNEIIKQKAGSPSIVINVLDLSSVLEELEEDNVITNKLSFTVIYRKVL